MLVHTKIQELNSLQFLIASHCSAASEKLNCELSGPSMRILKRLSRVEVDIVCLRAVFTLFIVLKHRSQSNVDTGSNRAWTNSFFMLGNSSQIASLLSILSDNSSKVEEFYRIACSFTKDVNSVYSFSQSDRLIPMGPSTS